MKSGFLITATLIAIGLTPAAAESLNVRLDKAEILHLDAPASVIVVGNPLIADVTIESPTLLYLTGLAPGETNMVIFDNLGDPVAQYDLVVIGEVDRHLTVHGNVEIMTTFSCWPRCVEVGDPSEVEQLRQFADPENKLGDAEPASASGWQEMVATPVGTPDGR